MQFRVSIIDERTNRQIDTRITHRIDRGHCEDFLAWLLPKVAHGKGIDVRYLRGDIRDLTPAAKADPLAAALLGSN